MLTVYFYVDYETAIQMSELRRELGLLEAVVYGTGLILGAGIYAILGEATGVTGGSIVISFLLAALIASVTGLSYAELASLFPKAEGDYIYVRNAFDREIVSDVTALGRLLMGVISSAAVALAFSGYLSAFVDVSQIWTAILIVVIMTGINFWGIDLSTKINILFTGIEVAGLVIIIWIGSGSWGSVEVLHTPNGVVGVLHASFLIFFAYLGFGSIVNLSEETEDATVTIPRAIILSLGFTTLIYLLVGLSAVSLVDWRVLGQSASPLAAVARVGWGTRGSTLLGAIALFSTTNTVLILQISTSRLLYGVSKSEYHVFPEIFSRVHSSRQTPHYAVMLVGIITIPFVFLGDIGFVAGLANLMLLVVFVLVNAALLKLRYSRPEQERGFRAPLNVGQLSITAVAGLISSLGLIAFYILTW